MTRYQLDGKSKTYESKKYSLSIINEKIVQYIWQGYKLEKCLVYLQVVSNCNYLFLNWYFL